MTRRTRWTAGFLAGTAIVVGAELLASCDGSPDTVPWTELVVTYLPAEVTAALIGALCLWLPVHFGIRYWRKDRDRNQLRRR